MHLSYATGAPQHDVQWRSWVKPRFFRFTQEHAERADSFLAVCRQSRFSATKTPGL